MADKEQKPKITDPSIRLPGFTTSYANQIAIEFTKFDLTLVLGQIARKDTESEIHVWSEDHGAVKMPLGQAKILAIMLAVNIANLEEQEVGPIKLPAGTIAKFVPDDMTGQPLMEMLEHLVLTRKAKAVTESTETPAASSTPSAVASKE